MPENRGLSRVQHVVGGVGVTPPEGSVVACDVGEKRIATGRCYREEAGVSDRVDLQLAAALEMLDRLRAADRDGSSDFAFIDAGKENQLYDYERTRQLLYPGGLMVIDITLWLGGVAEVTRQDPGTCAVRALNQHVHTDSRVHLGLLPVADGPTLERKV